MMQRLDFTEEDIAANRSGVLTADQKGRLGLMPRTSINLGACIVVAALLIFGPIIGYVLLRGSSLSLTSLLNLLMTDRFLQGIVGISMLVVGVPALVLIAQAAQRAAALRNERISVAEGKAHLSIKKYNSAPRTRGSSLSSGKMMTDINVQVGRTKFVLAQEAGSDQVVSAPVAYGPFHEGAQMRVYYVKFSADYLGNIILSAETISPSPSV
jgi:hypothetical protein